MKTIWKWTLKGSKTKLSMPKHTKVLTVQLQGEEIQLWAEVDTSQPEEFRAFEVYGTGHIMPSSYVAYIGTVQLVGGDFVVHVFEVTP